MSTQQQVSTATLFSREVVSAGRSFFFDVKRAPKGQLFLAINELSAQGGVWTRSRVVIPAGEAKEFYYGLCEAIKAMRQADRDGEISQSTVPLTAEQRLAKPKAAPMNRANGRASQGANRRALLAGVQ